jgi:hypothetical protein
MELAGLRWGCELCAQGIAVARGINRVGADRLDTDWRAPLGSPGSGLRTGRTLGSPTGSDIGGPIPGELGG